MADLHVSIRQAQAGAKTSEMVVTPPDDAESMQVVIDLYNDPAIHSGQGVAYLCMGVVPGTYEYLDLNNLPANFAVDITFSQVMSGQTQTKTIHHEAAQSASVIPTPDPPVPVIDPAVGGAWDEAAVTAMMLELVDYIAGTSNTIAFDGAALPGAVVEALQAATLANPELPITF